MGRKKLRKRYHQALSGLAANCDCVTGYGQPVLYEGGCYQGIWLECGPLESLVYRKTEDHRYLMRQWVEAITACPHFMQQLNPWNGEFTDSRTKDYSPTMCVFIDFVDRLRLL